ncbi:hypothetical protein AB4Y36_39330 [Paraburkholderia sp. BR10936]|uniref:hypothetical protein n=1 Tax=Paraburkholderia sp. BR10936 TaxID=3236993 RepID=UPI0034D32135
MKTCIFSIGVLLMLGFSFTGMALTAGGILRQLKLRNAPLLSLALAACALIALITTLAWSVPPRG